MQWISNNLYSSANGRYHQREQKHTSGLGRLRKWIWLIMEGGTESKTAKMQAWKKCTDGLAITLKT